MTANSALSQGIFEGVDSDVRPLLDGLLKMLSVGGGKKTYRDVKKHLKKLADSLTWTYLEDVYGSCCLKIPGSGLGEAFPPVAIQIALGAEPGQGLSVDESIAKEFLSTATNAARSESTLEGYLEGTLPLSASLAACLRSDQQHPPIELLVCDRMTFTSPHRFDSAMKLLAGETFLSLQILGEEIGVGGLPGFALLESQIPVDREFPVENELPVSIWLGGMRERAGSYTKREGLAHGIHALLLVLNEVRHNLASEVRIASLNGAERTQSARATVWVKESNYISFIREARNTLSDRLLSSGLSPSTFKLSSRMISPPVKALPPLSFRSSQELLRVLAEVPRKVSRFKGRLGGSSAEVAFIHARSNKTELYLHTLIKASKVAGFERALQEVNLEVRSLGGVSVPRTYRRPWQPCDEYKAIVHQPFAAIDPREASRIMMSFAGPRQVLPIGIARRGRRRSSHEEIEEFWRFFVQLLHHLAGGDVERYLEQELGGDLEGFEAK